MNRLQNTGLSLLSAALLSISWPARGFAPLLFVAWIPLLLIQDDLGGNTAKARRKGMFGFAYLTFVVWNTLTTWWIWNSTDFGAIMAILLNSLFMTMVFWLFHLTKVKLYQNCKGFFILIFYWMAWEWFHLDWDLSWPWLNLGNAFASKHQWIQWYEYTGTSGGTLWILIVNILIFKIIKAVREGGFSGRRVKIFSATAIVLILVPILASKQIYRSYTETGNKVEVVVVQPNFDPYTEQYELSPEKVIERNLSLAEQKISPETKFVVSPESAIQEEIWMEFTDRSPGLNQVKTFVQSHPQLAYVIGASTSSHVPKSMEDDAAARKFRKGEGSYFRHNTAFFVDTAGQLPFYHKSKLTPGVELMPSWRILKPLRSFAIDLGGTVGTLKTDNRRRVFSHQDAETKVSAIICYESIYGEFVTHFVQNGANLLFIITNDGWWGNTPGHRQHLTFARLRAIETRRSIARSANTGISGFVDQRGDLFQATPYNEQAVIKQQLALNNELTFYVKAGDYLSRIAALLSAIFALMALVKIAIKGKSAKIA